MKTLIRSASTKPRPRVLDKRDKARAEASNWRTVTADVRKRDGGKCRVCQKPGSHAHHIVYRSHGGKDVADNLILTCLDCHRLIHAHVVTVSFNPFNPARSIRFARNTEWD